MKVYSFGWEERKRSANYSSLITAGTDPGEVKWVNFHPLFLSTFLSFFSYPSNIEIIFDFSDIITKIHPPFQNPGSALAQLQKNHKCQLNNV